MDKIFKANVWYKDFTFVLLCVMIAISVFVLSYTATVMIYEPTKPDPVEVHIELRYQK